MPKIFPVIVKKAAAVGEAIGRWGPDFGSAKPTVGARISRLEYAMTGPTVPTKDTWVGHPPNCLGETPHNNTGLQIDSLAALPKDAWIGFDMSKFTSGGTVTSAELLLQVGTAPVAASTFSLSRIADADEGWGETTLQCSNSPAIGAVLQSGLAIPAAGNDVSVALNASWLSRLSARLGVGNMSFVLRMETAASSAIFRDREAGAAIGPRLRLTMTVPV